jgi:hypothetical protein
MGQQRELNKIDVPTPSMIGAAQHLLDFYTYIKSGLFSSKSTTDIMRSTSTFTIILSMATSVVCATSDIQARDEAPPLVRLYLGETTSRNPAALIRILMIQEQDGAEVYSPLFAFDDKCHSKLLDYGGIWINKDTRPEGDRQGCAYASTSDVCNDDMDWDPISLTFSGESMCQL